MLQGGTRPKSGTPHVVSLLLQPLQAPERSLRLALRSIQVGLHLLCGGLEVVAVHPLCLRPVGSLAVRLDKLGDARARRLEGKVALHLAQEVWDAARHVRRAAQQTSAAATGLDDLVVHVELGGGLHPGHVDREARAAEDALDAVQLIERARQPVEDVRPRHFGLCLLQAELEHLGRLEERVGAP
eukprot:6194479-Pleurochrysis_carterae.AAC.1